MFKMFAMLAAALTTAFMLPLPAHAAQGVKNALLKKFPDIKVDNVRKTEYGGLFEVVSGTDIYYTDDKASFVVIGQIIDTKTRDNVTEKRTKEITQVKWNELPLDQAIKITRGDGSRKVAVFADPYCGYCKRFEGDLAKVDNVTVYTFLLPIIRPESMALSKKVWCSKDRGAAWMDFMLKNADPSAEGNCDTPLDKNLAFGNKYKITGTPTLIFENGERVPGALNQKQIEDGLVRAAKKG